MYLEIMLGAKEKEKLTLEVLLIGMLSKKPCLLKF
jgi:hypothetical protein